MKRKGKSQLPTETQGHPPALSAGPANPFLLPCAWLGADGPCLLPGSIGHGRYDGDKVYCSWHGQFLVLGHDTAFVGNREEFERWVATRKGYCGVWSHHDSSALWFAAQGLAMLGMPQACGQADCRWRAEVEVSF